MADLGVIERGFVRCRGDRIESVGAGDPDRIDGEGLVDAAGCVVMPTFVDCHTHACWAGDRFDEFEMSLAGATYLEILDAGGGIMSTVRAVRAAGEDELAARLLVRLQRMARLGTGTVEVKTGYGLSTVAELKMLGAIQSAAATARQIVVPTFLGAHAIDRDNPDFIEETIEETLPRIVERSPGICCDAYCEEGAWSVDDTARLFARAQSLGCPLRIHTDQFNSLGMTRRAMEMGARSVDHLEAISGDDIERLAESRTIGVLLPCSGFHLDDRYAPGRRLIDAGCAIAIATNYNPGSAPTPSIPFAIALACRKLGLTAAEAICGATLNAARVLRLESEVGSLEPGKRADLQVLECHDERELAYEFATSGPRLVMLGGAWAVNNLNGV